MACLPQLIFAASDDWQGKRVSELLHSLNSQGYQIIFSSDVVTADLLIRNEPNLDDPLKGVRALLGENGLALENGPADTWLVRKRPPPEASESVAAKPSKPALPEIVVTSSLQRFHYV